MKFEKYQGTGNDFILMDARSQKTLKKNGLEKVRSLCDRKFGIGSDGLILIQTDDGKQGPAGKFDFEMVFFNPDGSQSFCGNGSRCAVAFAKKLGIVGETCRFLAIDGPHEAKIFSGKTENQDWVEVKMRDIEKVETGAPGTFVLDTGSPHFVRFLENLDGVDIFSEGQKVRYSPRFSEKGINVNLVCPSNLGISMLTYERGVENETLSCGTGVTAAALAFHLFSGKNAGQNEVAVKTRGGDLAVRFFAKPDGSFSDVWLCGPAAFVFSGKIQVSK